MTFTVRDHLNPLCSLVVVDGVWGWSRQQRPASFTSTRQALRRLASMKMAGGHVPVSIELVPHGCRVVLFNAAMVKAISNPTAKRRPLVGVRLSARLGLVADAQGLTNTTSRCRRHGRFQQSGPKGRGEQR